MSRTASPWADVPAEPHLARRFGARVRELRRARRLSQAALGGKLGVGKGTVARLERGATFPGDRIEAIARALGVEPVDLFNFGTGPRARPEMTAIVALVEAAATRDPAFARTALRVLRAIVDR